MSTSYYRLTVVACALSWFMVGLHVPALHWMTHHGGTPPWTVLAVMSLLAAAAVAGLWILLRSPARRAA
jgi:hypothetical protein